MAAVNSVNSGPEEQRNNTNMAHRRCWPLLFYSSHCSKYPQSFFIKCPIILQIDFFRFLEVYLTKLSMLTNLCILSKRILVQHFKNVQKGSTMNLMQHMKRKGCVCILQKRRTHRVTQQDYCYHGLLHWVQSARRSESSHLPETKPKAEWLQGQLGFPSINPRPWNNIWDVSSRIFLWNTDTLLHINPY